VSNKLQIASVFLAGGVSFSACLCNAAEPTETAKADTLQHSRELVARSYDQRGVLSSPAQIVLRPAKEDSKTSSVGSWWAQLGLGKSSTANDRPVLEIFGRLKSGQETVIDRISREHLSSVPLIVDSAGSVVGYFLYSSSKEDMYASARGTFAMYFVREQSLVHVTGEVRCKKVGSEGEPKLRFSNAHWDNTGRELTFDVRSSCGMVEFFGGLPGRSLLDLSGSSHEHFKDALEKNTRPYTEEGGRIQVIFRDNGAIASVDIDSALKRGARARKQEIEECREKAKGASSIRLCGPGEYKESIAIWRLGDDLVELRIECTSDHYPTIDERRDRVVGVCETKQQTGNGRILEFVIAHQQSPKLIEFQVECVCDSLTASRFHFDFYNRAISFNLKTDATAIKLEGGEFRLPTISPEERDGRSALSVPIFTVQFNDHWQVIGIGATTQ
jgi:hypothetical protein